MQTAEINTAPSKKSTKRSKTQYVFYILLFIVVGILLLASGYYLGKNNSNSEQAEGTPKSVIAAKTSEAFHFVISEGYPYSTDKKVIIKLAVPDELQAVRYSSSIQDPGLADGWLGDKFNGEMGRWKLGRSDISDSTFNDISVVNIENAWIDMTTTGNEIPQGQVPFSLPIPNVNMSSSQKKTFIAQIQLETKNCSVSKKTGFVISDTVNVCVTPYQIKQSQGSYSPYVNIKGYGSIEGLHFVIAGTLSLRDQKTYSIEDQVSLQETFTANNLPRDTQEVFDRYVSALQHSIISLESR